LSAAALGLALAAAVLHALWNLLLARERDTEATTAVSLAVFVAALAPLAAASWRVEGAAVPYILGSGALELAYVALLAAAYRRFELSLVYPLARGLAPVLALVVVVALLGASPSGGEIGGVIAVAIGILLVRGVRGRGRGVGLAVVIAAAIAGYTVVDRYGIRHANAAPYLLLVMLGPAAAYPLSVGRVRLRAAARPVAALIGVASAATYLLVLLALRLASAPSVSAVRETSVVIAVVLAALFLQEPVGQRRLAGAAIVVAGVALLALS
jgi:drug/metabolite transporter (DMT)-like permease